MASQVFVYFRSVIWINLNKEYDVTKYLFIIGMKLTWIITSQVFVYLWHWTLSFSCFNCDVTSIYLHTIALILSSKVFAHLQTVTIIKLNWNFNVRSFCLPSFGYLKYDVTSIFVYLPFGCLSCLKMNSRSVFDGANIWAVSVVVKARQWSLIGGVCSAKRSGMNQPNLESIFRKLVVE